MTSTTIPPGACLPASLMRRTFGRAAEGTEWPMSNLASGIPTREGASHWCSSDRADNLTPIYRYENHSLHWVDVCSGEQERCTPNQIVIPFPTLLLMLPPSPQG